MRLLLVVAPLLAASLTWSQPSMSDSNETTVGSRDITIEVDSAQTRNQDKSLGLALLGSALLPGAGEAYLSENKSARNFFPDRSGFLGDCVCCIGSA